MKTFIKLLANACEFSSTHYIVRCSLCLVLFINANAWASHPTNSSVQAKHPVIPLPENVLAPLVSTTIIRDAMDGFNLNLTLHNFDLIAPTSNVGNTIETVNGTIISGHAHLYINGIKIMRVYAEQIHLPDALFNSGINSVTVSLNTHNHETFTLDDKEIQSTTIINTNEEEHYIKSHYQWPQD